MQGELENTVHGWEAPSPATTLYYGRGNGFWKTITISAIAFEFSRKTLTLGELIHFHSFHLYPSISDFYISVSTINLMYISSLVSPTFS